MEYNFWQRWQYWIVGGSVFSGILAWVFFSLMLFTVPAGTVGVKFDPFVGGVQPDEYQEGIHVKAPWVTIDFFNIKTQDYTMVGNAGEGEGVVDDSNRVVTSEGLYVDLDLTVLYRIDPTMASNLRQEVGIDGQYQSIIVRPTIRSIIRDVVSRYEASDIYGDSRSTVQDEIEQSLITELEGRGIIIEQFLLRKVVLPAQLVTSIELKKQAEQDALRRVYVIEKEELEKDRKIIEAGGIAQANAIINESLSTAYLTWYWIENLENHNSVVYVVPSDGGLPIFKNIDEPIPD